MCARVFAEAVVALGGIIVLVWAATTGRTWVDRHFLPDYFHPQPGRYELAMAVRIVAAVAGVAAIAFLRPYVGRVVAEGRGIGLLGGVLRVFIALGLALLVSEGLLRTSVFKPRRASPVGREPIQQPHAQLGWTLVPDHVGQRIMGGRTIEYVTDRNGYRVRCAGCVIDPARPSILFTGESIMLGTGLYWNETVPGRVESLLGMQSVDLAVNGYANDQAYLRLVTELPRFQRPMAVVSLFMSTLLPRSLNVDRPHLDAALHWHPAVTPWRLQALADRLLNYSSTAEVDRAIATTRAALRATAELAHSRQAVALVLVPRFVPETPMERELRERILDANGLDYVLVDLDRSWTLSDDAHPNARGAQVMADAVAERLRRMLGHGAH